MASEVFQGVEPNPVYSEISPNQYQFLALRTENTPPLFVDEPGMIERLDHASRGFCTEAGEFQDPLKRHLIYQKDWAGKSLEEFKANLAEEVGDILWYCALAADALGLTLEQIMLANVRKLAERYKSKTGNALPEFNSNQAINRDLKAEERALAGANEPPDCDGPDWREG